MSKIKFENLIFTTLKLSLSKYLNKITFNFKFDCFNFSLNEGPTSEFVEKYLQHIYMK